MKRHIIILLITFLYLPEYLEAQLKYYDATEFPLYGKATKNTENRDKHPRTPIIFIEDPVFAHALFDKKIAIEINKKNKAVNSVFKSLKTNKEVLKYIDVLVDGQYVDELRDPRLKYNGSSNQRVIDVQNSVKQGKVIFYKDK